MVNLKEITLRSFVRVPALLLIALIEGPIIVANIGREVGVTYSYASKSLEALSLKNMVTSKVNGRSRVYELTPKGLEITELLLSCKIILEN